MVVPITTFLLFLMLTLIAVVLYLTEIYFIPGLGFAGILAAAMTLAVLYFSFLVSPYLSVVLFSIGVLAFILGFWYLSKSKFIEKNSLHKTIDGRSPSHVNDIVEGMEGITLSRLTLTGNIQLGSLICEASSDGGFIDEGMPVIVVRKEGNKIFVRPV